MTIRLQNIKYICMWFAFQASMKQMGQETIVQIYLKSKRICEL